MVRFHARILATCTGITPVQALGALPESAQAVLLDSSNADGWSLLAWRPDKILQGNLQAAGECADNSGWPLASEDPAQLLEDITVDEYWCSPPEPLPAAAWVGGWLGWFGYECGHAWEKYPWVKRVSTTPDYHFSRYRHALAFSPQGQAYLCLSQDVDDKPHDSSEEQQLLLDFAKLQEKCREGKYEASQAPKLTPTISEQMFIEQVSALRDWIGQGELFQANLSHRMTARLSNSPAGFYQQIRAAQETSMSAFWQNGQGQAMLSWSPERFLRVNGSQLQTRPIKGTIARGITPVDDANAKQQLSSDQKERAELTMIVDMARNDLGRVAKHGQVRVLSTGEVESWPTLHHRTATIEAQWDPSLGLAKLIAATFPPASVTGAPKVRALRAISELESEGRGPYCGCFGIWQPGINRGDFSVLIRTAEIEHQQLSLRMAAGIVWDSNPQREWEETLLKAQYLQQ